MKRKTIFSMLILAFMLALIPQRVQAASKNANYKTITKKWKKIHGGYFKKAKGGKIYYKADKNGTTEEIHLGEMTECYTNGFYIYIYYYSGADDHQMIRYRRATAQERANGEKSFVIDWNFSKVYYGLWDADGRRPIWTSLTGKKYPYLGRNKNSIWMLVGIPTDNGEKRYLYCYNMKTNKCKKIRMVQGEDYGYITVSKRYLYGIAEAQGVPQKAIVVDRKTGKHWKSAKKMVDWKFQNGKAYGIQEKNDQSTGIFYYRVITMNGSAKKVLKTGKWSTKYPW